MAELSKGEKESIINQNIRQLEATKFDLEIGISVNNKVGEDPDKTEQLKDRLVEVNKKLEAYNEQLENLE